jgi:uncharacterized Zn-binding protein involved in type VI secretion
MITKEKVLILTFIFILIIATTSSIQHVISANPSITVSKSQGSPGSEVVVSVIDYVAPELYETYQKAEDSEKPGLTPYIPVYLAKLGNDDLVLEKYVLGSCQVGQYSDGRTKYSDWEPVSEHIWKKCCVVPALAYAGDWYIIIMGTGNKASLKTPFHVASRTREAEPEYGVIEKDGKLYLVSPPGGTLSISMSDLPEWVRPQIVTVGAMAICVGPPDAVATGDSNILLDGLPVARVNDLTVHGGTIIEGSDRIFVNGVPAAFPGALHVCPLVNPGSVPHVGGPIVHGHLDFSEMPDDSEMSSWINTRLRALGYDEITVLMLKEDVSQGSTVLQVYGEGIEIGDAVIIGSDPDLVETARVAGKGSIVLDRPLKNSYPAGTWITRIPDEYADLVPPPSIARTSGLTIDPNSVEKGETVTVSVEVTNTGEESGTHDVTLMIDGDVKEEKTVTLNPNESETVSFEVSTSQLGTFEVEVNGLSGSYTVTEKEEEPFGGIPGFPYEVIILGVVAGVVILWWMKQRRN